ncbi:zinc-dependent alcohol dehydrogenase family protein [Rhodococcus fascians]|nr:zinc-dependent alcohol dehydrogenase family protein [Rhodococcus fascians]MBY3998497.1 zinc-dependent alcohol dehydrogenase family protein [Rhodococcus fascians]MBY4004509.1 zinc-dependent alcohol dehydrogenase family protein [Rhodococcus fascians]MBY4009310.1 zinc-dependent alcohol dehydrogenase family protein [Rhodococcus fascians]MBY4019716.1 zinc-dependent alcohol dehydrogenase family protein [Rhodococcus fascians]
MTELHLSDLPPGHVRVKIRAIGLNRFEALFRRDHYVIAPVLPATLGVEAAGVVTSVAADVDGFAAGDRVAVLPIQSPAVGTGTYATHADVPVESLVHIADDASDEEEAATWMASLQAYTLAAKVPITPGDVVVVTAGTSSVGTALMHIARDRGATVVATTRTSARKTELTSLGADYVVATDEEDLAAVVASVTDGRGARVVYDTVGGHLMEALIAATAPFGHILCYGAQTSPDFRAARVDVPLVSLDRKSISFVDLFELVEFPDKLAAAKAYIGDARRRGVLEIQIDRVLPFDDVQSAHRILEEGRLSGKLVLRVS